MASRVQKLTIPPINLIFRYLQNKQRVEIWLFEQTATRLEGLIMGFDEFMNVVLDDTEEITVKTKERTSLGRLLLKGDNITLISAIHTEGEEME